MVLIMMRCSAIVPLSLRCYPPRRQHASNKAKSTRSLLVGSEHMVGYKSREADSSRIFSLPSLCVDLSRTYERRAADGNVEDTI
jgi:hypothetical protein